MGEKGWYLGWNHLGEDEYSPVGIGDVDNRVIGERIGGCDGIVDVGSQGHGALHLLYGFHRIGSLQGAEGC